MAKSADVTAKPRFPQTIAASSISIEMHTLSSVIYNRGQKLGELCAPNLKPGNYFHI